MDLQLKDKSVIVTGGAKGIGLAITKAFLEEGAEYVWLERMKRPCRKSEHR